MSTLLRYTLILIAAVVLLVVAAGIAVTLLVDPNDYRDEIAAAVEAETGRRLTLDGDIDLTAFPCCSLKLGPATLSNPPGWPDTGFAAIDSAAVSLRVLPLLLSQELQVGDVELNGLLLNLHAREDGQVNWAFDTAATEQPNADGGDTAGAPGAGLAVAGIAVRDARVNYRDDVTGDDIALTGINLTTGTIRAGEPVSISASVAAEGLVEERALAFDMDADALFDEAIEQFALENIRAQFDDSTLTGVLRVTDIEQQALEFDLQLDRLNADAYIGDESAGDSAGEAGGSEATSIPSGAIRVLQVNGALSIGALTFSGANLSDIVVTVNADDGLVKLNPLTANLYGGAYQGNVRLNVRGNVPRLVVDERLQGIQLNQLLQDTADISDVAGTGNIRLQGEARSGTVEGLLEQLTGAATFDLQDGLYQGVDLWHEIRSARALLKKEAPPSQPENPQTQLSEFSGTLNFADGAVDNPDFTASVPFMRLSGKGRFSLIDSGLDYALQARIVETPTFADGEDLDSLTGLTLPISLKGTLESPKIRVDLGDLARSAAERKLEDKLRKRLGLDDEAATTDETSLTEEKDLKDEAKDELKRKLRGLFD